MKRESFYKEKNRRNKEYSEKKDYERELRLREIYEEREESILRKKQKINKKMHSASKRKRIQESLEKERIRDMSLVMREKRKRATVKRLEFEKEKEEVYHKNTERYYRRKEKARQRRKEKIMVEICQKKLRMGKELL